MPRKVRVGIIGAGDGGCSIYKTLYNKLKIL